MKNCARCKTEKDLTAFGSNRSRTDGLAGYCKPCNKKYKKDYHEKNSDKHSINGKKWRESHVEEKKDMDRIWIENNRDKSRKIKQRWKDNNPEKVKEMSKNYSISHAEELRQKNKQWRLDNLEKCRLKEHRRRARIRQNGVFIVSDKEIKNLLGKPCFYCGEKSMHIDHIVPISRGGNHSIGNIVQACAHCNLSKNAKFITEWKKVSQ
jgi:hypothetical protein